MVCYPSMLYTELRQACHRAVCWNEDSALDGVGRRRTNDAARHSDALGLYT